MDFRPSFAGGCYYEPTPEDQIPVNVLLWFLYIIWIRIFSWPANDFGGRLQGRRAARPSEDVWGPSMDHIGVGRIDG